MYDPSAACVPASATDELGAVESIFTLTVRKWIAAMPLESSVAVNVTVTGDVYQLFAPLLPEALYVVTGGVMSLTLPGETAYVDGVDIGIVNVRPPTGVDCALRIRFVPPLFARVTLYVVLGVQPEPSSTTAAAT